MRKLRKMSTSGVKLTHGYKGVTVNKVLKFLAVRKSVTLKTVKCEILGWIIHCISKWTTNKINSRSVAVLTLPESKALLSI